MICVKSLKIPTVCHLFPLSVFDLSSPTDSLPIEFSRFLLAPILFTALSFPEEACNAAEASASKSPVFEFEYVTAPAVVFFVQF